MMVVVRAPRGSVGPARIRILLAVAHATFVDTKAARPFRLRQLFPPGRSAMASACSLQVRHAEMLQIVEVGIGGNTWTLGHVLRPQDPWPAAALTVSVGKQRGEPMETITDEVGQIVAR